MRWFICPSIISCAAFIASASASTTILPFTGLLVAILQIGRGQQHPHLYQRQSIHLSICPRQLAISMHSGVRGKTALTGGRYLSILISFVKLDIKNISCLFDACVPEFFC